MLNISFNFNEQTRQITDIKVVELSISSGLYDLEIKDNKLVLSSSAIEKLRAVPGDRISINYWMVDKSTTYPLISKADLMENGDEGNKLTKSGSVSFKGQQRTTLLKFGSRFDLVEWIDKSGNVKDGVFRLKPIEDIIETDAEILANDEKLLEEVTEQQLEDDLAGLLKDDTEEYDMLPF